MNNATAFISVIAFTGILLPAAVSAQTEAAVDVKVETRSIENRGFLGIFGDRSGAQERKEKRAEDHVQRQEERTERGANVQARSASSSIEVRMNLSKDRKARVEKHVDTIYGTLSASLERLASFEGRVEARLDELAATGIDVSLSREKLDSASTVRIAAVANIASLEANLKAVLTGETSRNEIMDIMKKAREELAMVRKAYAEVLIQVRADVTESRYSR
ncbi:MAG: hypothetical protein Q8K68_12450 [Nitrospirota bacterium]|nr:hypothetical protein [Nitrospirota bacterium]